MRARKLTRWQKASALIPMAVLVGAWGVALTNTGLASAITGNDDDTIPAVPNTAFEMPASVQETPAGIDPRSGTEGALETLSTNGIPASALAAYRRAESLLAQADASCNLSWSLLAAIGRVESDHGRINGNALSTDGVATPGIYGPRLDGSNGTMRILDTDNGVLDNDTEFDRAVGPMQFIPTTWEAVGVDADNDGVKNPQDIDDAATSAGIYLCAGDGDLSDPSDLRSAVLRYNRSATYADTVIAISEAYANGDFTRSPDNLSASSPLVHRGHDQSTSPEQRQAAIAEEQQAAADAAAAAAAAEEQRSGGSSAGGGSNAPAPSNPSPSPSPTTPAPAPNGGVTGLAGGLAADLGGAGGGNPPLSNTLTWAEAKVECLTRGLSALDVVGLSRCITELLS